MKKLLLILMVTVFANAKTKITKVEYKNDGNFGIVTISLDGELKNTPELTIKDETVQLALADTIVWPKIENKVTVNNKFDATVMAYQYNQELVRVRANLPYNLNGKENKVSVVLGDKSVSLYFPKLETKATSAQNVSKTVTTAAKKERKSIFNENEYDESYLAKLLKDKEEKSDTKVEKIVKAQDSLKKEEVKQVVDTVKTISSSVSKEKFSMSSYIVKFVGFFALLIAGIYFMMNFFRKGMLKKSGMGFFSSAKMVEVLSTTYLGPKRSILVLRVHEQVFLVAQSEKGMDFLTEITDTAAFIKEGEKAILGSNFDTNLSKAKTSDKEFKLKDMISADDVKVEISKPRIDLEAMQKSQTEKSKFTKQIKNKIKDLKQFQ